jgi:hypothetical protein
VGLGEVISVCVLGTVLLNVLNKYRGVIFRESVEYPDCAAGNE